MTDDTRDVIARAILHYRGDGPQQDDEEQMAWTIFEALAVAGLVIQSADEAEARVAAAERKGMERAAVIAETHGMTGDPSEYHRTAQNNVAAAIRAEMEAADG